MELAKLEDTNVEDVNIHQKWYCSRFISTAQLIVAITMNRKLCCRTRTINSRRLLCWFLWWWEIPVEAAKAFQVLSARAVSQSILPRGGETIWKQKQRWKANLFASKKESSNNGDQPSALGNPLPGESILATAVASSASNSSFVPSASPSLPLLEYNATTDDAGSLSLPELLTKLGTNLETGLSQVDIEQRRYTLFGYNAVQPPPGTSIWELILEQFQDRLVQILLVVALISGIFSALEVYQGAGAETTTAWWKSFVEPTVIVAILIGNAAVGVFQSQSAKDSLDALQKLQPALATVLRDSTWITGIEAKYLVPGDILQIRVGDKIPADARLVSLTTSTTLQVDEGSLTGESTTVSKIPGEEGRCKEHNAPIQEQRGMLYGGTIVTRGTGLAVVTHTGAYTQFGKIQQGVVQAQMEQIKTPLAIKLDEFGNTLSLLIGVICVAVWIVSIPKMNDPSFGRDGQTGDWIQGAIYYAKVAVALGVAAIPEGLPAVITLCLSLGTRRMAQRNVIVRKLSSVETLGCTSVICTDKTGTLTTNEMTVVSLILLEKKARSKYETSGNNLPNRSPTVVEHAVEGYSYSPIGTVEGIIAHKEIHENPQGSVADVAAVSALCNDAKVVGNDAALAKGTMNEDVVGKSDQTKTENPHSSINDKSNNSDRNPKNKIQEIAQEKAYVRVGEPTEAALCVLAEKLGGLFHYFDPEASLLEHMDPSTGLHINIPPSVLASANVNSWRSTHPRHATLEFDRNRKSMSVLCDYTSGLNGKAKQDDGSNMEVRNRLLVKGAPNLLIERCTHIKLRDGTEMKLTNELRREIMKKTSELATRPLRCLALAVKEHKNLESSLQTFSPGGDEGDATKHPLLSDSSKYRDIESGLTLVGIVGIKDPARPEVADSIKLCSRAGIRVIMITGDAKDTAVAIARDVNIFPPSSDEQEDELKAYEGREFFKKKEKEQLDILREGNIVFCRAEPADKQRLVKMLQSLNEIPAMTGDGVNDAPALQQAAIGVAMGITGTEVAKDAADMILVDDNFSTIVNAVEEGRRIYANMQAFICFLISCNIGEICAIFFATLAGFPEPMGALQLLWINLVTDGMLFIMLMAVEGKAQLTTTFLLLFIRPACNCPWLQSTIPRLDGATSTTE